MKKKMIAGMLGLLILTGAAFGAGCTKEPADLPPTDGSGAFVAVGDNETLLALVQTAVKRSEERNGMWLMDGAKAVESEAAVEQNADSATSGMGSGEGGAGYSETNVQVAGVDEADVIKTDGEYIYRVNADYNEVEIIRAEADGTLTATGKVTITPSKEGEGSYESHSIREIYLDGNYLTVISNNYYGYGAGYNAKEAETDTLWPGNDSASVSAAVYDLTDKAAPKLLRSVEMEGNYSDSRKVGGFVYLLSEKYVYYYDLRELKAEEQSEQVSPYYRDSAVAEEYQDVPLDRIYYCPDDPASLDSGTLNIGVLDVAGGSDFNVQSYIGGGSNLYMDDDTLYVASMNWDTAESETATTTIHRFDVDGLHVAESATGSVPGTILNQFSMDEYEGNFRIATTASREIEGEYATDNNVYILDAGLKTIGALENLAKGEQIYSVRFMGDTGYMVTFEQVDPLFVLDLSDPTAPKSVGELKIPGYSDYLHPYDEDTLIGFGKESVSYQPEWADEPIALYQDLKISIFDVSDMENPVEVDKFTIGDRGTESDILYDHKALLFDKEKNLLAIPITVYEREGAVETPEAYGDFKTQGCYIFRITDDSIELVDSISHLSADEADYDVGYTQFIDRSLYIGDTFFASSKSRLSSHTMADWQQLDVLDF